MEIQELGRVYVAVAGNEHRGDQCGCCGQPIHEGEKFYSWSFSFSSPPDPARLKTKYPVWVQLHVECLVDVAETEVGVSDAQFELYRKMTAFLGAADLRLLAEQAE